MPFDMLPCDVTYLVEKPPSIEIREGLVYITDELGARKLCRAMRPSTLLRGIRAAKVVAGEFDAEHGGNVERIEGSPA